MATKPVIIAVDDDPPVLRAVERDLRRRYGKDYQVVAADSGAGALDVVNQLKLRGSPIALLLVDQRMPGMTGVEFLAKASEVVPDTKRVLLTAYADTEVAIRAINEIRLDHYLLKPWDPPEEKLYPILDELLEDWGAAYQPPFEGITLVGHPWSARAHEMKDYLTRNQIPYRWLDIETSPEAKRFAEAAGLTDPRLPLLVFPDGTSLIEPTNRDIAAKLGRRTQAGLPFYDLIIVGGGPAGLAAAVYGASEGLKTLLVEREAAGGQAGTTSRIENYLGFPSGLSGADLARRGVAQASRLGAELLSPQDVVALRREDPYRFVALADGAEVSCHAVLLAMGVQYRKLELPGADALAGIGIFYGAAITEALACRGQDVGIVGGGNSAGQAAIYLAGFARHVTLIVRGSSLEAGMSQYLVDRIRDTENISVRLNSSVVEVIGENELKSVTLEDSAAGMREPLPIVSLFLFIGAAPRTDWLGDLVVRDGAGFVLSGPALLQEGKRPAGWTLTRDPFLLETSVPGIFVAGDVRSGSVKRIASAVGEGSMAIMFVHQHLAGL